VLTGAAEAVLAQGDMHTAIVLLMSVAAAGAWLLATSRGERLQVAGRLFVFGVTLTGLCVPFLMQRLLEHPDVPRRFGVFPVSPATAVGFLLETGDLGSTLGAMAALLATGGLLWASDATEAAAARARAMAAWAGILACSCAALPMSALLLGRAIQPYHFEMSRAVLTRYGLVVALTYLVQRLLDVLRAGEPLGGVRALVARRAGAVVALFLCLLGAKGFALAARDSFCRTNQGHVRADLSEYRSLPDYRRNFKALVSELEKPAYGRCRVLATFDHQVFAWWTSFRRGYAFNPDPFSSAVCDAEIERRLLLFCKALRMTPDDFGSFLDRPNVNLLWLGCAKYQASRAHTFAPMGEYTERQREQILRSSLQDSWTLVVPQAEKARLARLYADVAAVSEMPRLDVMILTNDESLRSFAPSAGEYEEVYRNAAFRVFLNRGSVVQARRRGPAASGRVSG
jgi:hypothetical protein